MHRFPDADALASAYIIKELLNKRHNNLNICLLIEDTHLPTPGLNGLNLKDCKLINNKNFLDKAPEGGWSVYIIDHSDTTYSILKNWNAPNIKEIKLVDHHIYYGTCPKDSKLFLDDSAHSTTQVIYEYLEKNNYEHITKEIATATYIGLFSDTLKLKTPIFERDFRLINRLIDKGLNIKESNQYVRGEHLIRSKALGECMFLHVNKAKNSETATVILNKKKFDKFQKQYVTVNCILGELLRKPYIDHTLIRYEPLPHFGCVRIQTTDFGIVSSGKENYPSRPNYHVWAGLKEKQAATLVKNLRQRLDRGDKEKQPKNLGDQLINIEIPEEEPISEEDKAIKEEYDTLLSIDEI